MWRLVQAPKLTAPMAHSTYAAVAIELSLACPCGAEVALAAVVPSVSCDACGHRFELAADCWAALLRDPLAAGAAMTPGEQKEAPFESPAGVVRRSWRRVAAQCPACAMAFDAAALGAIECPGHLPCAGCGNAMYVRRVPEIAPAA